MHRTPVVIPILAPVINLKEAAIHDHPLLRDKCTFDRLTVRVVPDPNGGNIGARELREALLLFARRRPYP